MALEDDISGSKTENRIPMNLKFQLAFIGFNFLLLLIPTATAQSSWRSTYYPEDWTPPENANFYTDAFIQDFSYAGYHMGEIPLPTSDPGISVDVTDRPYAADPTGATSSTAAIQAAIDDVGNQGGGVVFLPPGTYRVEPGSRDHCLEIRHSHVVLRGAGPNQTRIFNNSSNMRQKAIIKVIPASGPGWNSNHSSSMTNITADLMTPTRFIPVQSVSQFSAGDWVIVRNNMTDAWADEHLEVEWKARKSSLRGTTFYRQIVAINSSTNEIEIDVPLRYALKPRDNARVYLAPPMLEEVGIENLAIGNRESTNTTGWQDPDGTLNNNAHSNSSNGAYHNHQSWLIDITRIRNSWIRNVSSYQPNVNSAGSHMLSNGIILDECRGVTLESVHLKSAQYGGGGGNGYGFRIQSNEILLTDCSAETFRHGFVISFMRASGIVIHRSLDADSRKCTGVTGRLRTGSSGSDFHMWFSPSCLIDDMTMHNSLYRIVHRLGVANDHNAVTAHSVVWNIRAMGNRFPLAVATSQTRYGYVIGTSGDRPDVRYQPPDNWAFRYDVGGIRSAPVDIVEGIGQGATLQPQSLYLDQLARRLGDDSGVDPEPVEPLIPLKVASVTASDHQDPNVPENTLDDDPDTRWSAQGDGQYIEFMLEEPATVSQAWIAWFNGNERFFSFEIETSMDGVAWTNVYSDLSGSTSSLSNTPQSYDVTETVARYIRIIGYGNTVNDWNSINSVSFVSPPPFWLTRTEMWRSHHFGTTDDTGEAAMTANPDGDAYDNWAEYILGTDPAVPNFDPPLEIDDTGDPFTLAFNTREATGPGYEGLIRYYTVEYSEDFSIWHELEDARDIAGTGRRVVVEFPDGIEGRRFFRLKVRIDML